MKNQTFQHANQNKSLSLVLLQGEGLVGPRQRGEALPHRPRPLRRRGPRQGGQILPAVGAARAVPPPAQPGGGDGRLQGETGRRRDRVAPQGLAPEQSPRGPYVAAVEPFITAGVWTILSRETSLQAVWMSLGVSITSLWLRYPSLA